MLTLIVIVVLVVCLLPILVALAAMAATAGLFILGCALAAGLAYMFFTVFGGTGVVCVVIAVMAGLMLKRFAS